MFFAACMTFQSDTRANVSEESEGLLCFSRLCMTFQKIPEQMSLKSQEALTCLFLVQHTDHIFSFPELTALKAIRGLCNQLN